MALSQVTDIADALSQLFAPRLARQYNHSSVLGAVLPTERGFGKNVAWDVEMDGVTAESYAEGSDVQDSEFQTNTLVPATLTWAHYRSCFHVSETELDAARTSSGSADALIRLFENRVMGSGSKLASKINQELWTGDGTDSSSNPTIVGISGGALATSGSYANISRVTYALWQGNVLGNGGVGRPLSVDLMEQAETEIFKDCGLRPNVILAHPDVVRKYKGLFESVRRIEGQGPIARYDTSTSDVFFQGIPVLRDKDCPAGTMAMLNLNHCSKVFLPSSSDAAVADVRSMQMEGAGHAGEGEENNLGLPFRIVPLEKAGDSVKLMIKAVVQLKVTRPHAHALIQDIA